MNYITPKEAYDIPLFNKPDLTAAEFEQIKQYRVIFKRDGI